MSAVRGRPRFWWRDDPHTKAVAEATGWDVDDVHSRGVKFCRDNPRASARSVDADIDQSMPDFEPVRRVDLEDADTPADFMARTRLPSGMVDTHRDVELVPTGRTADGIARHILAEGTQVARVANGDVLPVRLERIAVRGGVSVRGRIGNLVIFEIPAMSEAEADMREPMHTSMLYAGAHEAAEIIKFDPDYFRRG